MSQALLKFKRFKKCEQFSAINEESSPISTCMDDEESTAIDCETREFDEVSQFIDVSQSD